MARRFVRIDLSDTARDFRPTAVEPGVPLLDKSGGHAKILFKWLGGLVAEPEWEGESVNFYVRDDHGGRLEEVHCQLASEEELKGILKGDVEAVRQRLGKVKPETSTERAVHKIVCALFVDLIDNPNRIDRANYFFRYRDVQGRWRLVWCWGYQRTDQEPASPLVCTDAKCNLLFVRRPGESLKCPSCAASLAMRPVRPKRSGRRVLARVLAILLALLLLYWLFTRDRLVGVPGRWEGPVGSRVAFKVMTPGLFGLGRRDVTGEVVAVSADPRIARVDRFQPVAIANSPGKTAVRFFLGKRSSSATMTVAAARNPGRLAIEPEIVELGIGTTARPRVIGEYEDGARLDLTESAEWTAKNDGVVFACDGLLEGLAPGNSTATARYRASPENEYLEASVPVSVAKIDFKSVDITIDPLPVRVGRASALEIDAVTAEGKKYSVLESSRLRATVEPADLAAAYERHLQGKHPGHGILAVEFAASGKGTVPFSLRENRDSPRREDRDSPQGVSRPLLTAAREFDVVADPAVDRLLVSPERVEMLVGEILDLDILSPSSEPVEVTSSSPDVVEVAKGNRLIGRAQGTAKVEVRQAGQARSVDVSIVPGTVQSIAVKPRRVVVPVADARGVRVLGRTDAGRQVELAPDGIQCEKAPAPEYATFDAKQLELRGVRPTDANKPQPLVLAFQQLRAESPVEVIAGPGGDATAPAVAVGGEPPVELFVLSDQGPSVRFPVGARFNDFQVEARYQDGMTRLVTRKATLLAEESAERAPVSFDKGHMVGVRPGKTTVQAEFQGTRTKAGLDVEVVADVDIDELRVEPAPVKLLPGETVGMEATGYKAGKSVGLLTGLEQLQWKADNQQVVRVQGASVTAAQPGKAAVTAQLASVVSKPAEISVVGSIDEAFSLQTSDGKRLDAIAMLVGDRLRLGTDFSMVRGNVDFSPHCQVTPMRSDVVAFDQASRSLVAVAPGQSPVKFSEGEKSLMAVVQVLPAVHTAVVEPATDLRIEPAEATIHPGQGLLYRVTGVRGGQRVLLGPQDGLRLSTADPGIAAPVGGTAVQGERPGRTEVVAQAGPQQAKANLNVVAGIGVPQAIVDVLPGGVVVDGAGPYIEYYDSGGLHTIHPGRRRYGTSGEVIIEGPGGGVILRPTESVSIEPRRVSVKVGESTPHFTVSIRGSDGSQRTVDGVPLSTDESILVRDSQDAGRFTARSLGRTQVRATYGDREVFADVTVTGERFAAIKTSIADQGDRDFEVAADIVAADPDTPLEYRAYLAGQAPPDTWTASEQQGGSRRAVVQSPRIVTGPPSAFYQLIFECRDPRDNTIQKYPYTFRLGRTIEEVKEAPAAPSAKAPASSEKPAEPMSEPDEAEEKPGGQEKPGSKEQPGAKKKPRAKEKPDESDNPFAGWDGAVRSLTSVDEQDGIGSWDFQTNAIGT